MSDAEKWMDEALGLAELGRGWTSPNPVVGAVVVRDGVVVGRGWHQAFGGPHAEIFALREAGKLAHGATLFCTLEPCNHFGKTPPCSHAVVEAGIKTVVLGARDLNARAAGGVEALRMAGVEVVEGVRAKECARINAPFFKVMKTGLPFVALKWAMSLDGKIASATGDSKWISNEKSRAHVHMLRARHDALAAGSGTIRADDPSLNARLENLVGESNPAGLSPALKQPLRVIFDSNASTPLDAKLWSADPAGAVVVVVRQDADREHIQRLHEKGADVIDVPRDAQGRPAVEAALRALVKRGVLSVMVEGGAQLLGSFADAKLADRAHVFIAPKIIGGTGGKSALGGTGVAKIAQAMRFKEGSLALRQFDEDVLIEGALSEWGD